MSRTSLPEPRGSSSSHSSSCTTLRFSEHHNETWKLLTPSSDATSTSPCSSRFSASATSELRSWFNKYFSARTGNLICSYWCGPANRRQQGVVVSSRPLTSLCARPCQDSCGITLSVKAPYTESDSLSRLLSSMMRSPLTMIFCKDGRWDTSSWVMAMSLCKVRM